MEGLFSDCTFNNDWIIARISFVRNLCFVYRSRRGSRRVCFFFHSDDAPKIEKWSEWKVDDLKRTRTLKTSSPARVPAACFNRSET